MKSLINRSLFAILLPCVITLSLAHAKNDSEKTKMDFNQVWTFTYEELDSLPPSQKDEFSKSLIQEASNNTVLKKINMTSEENLKTVLSSEEKWTATENKISSYCQDSHNYTACEKLSKIRVDLLLKYSLR